jgi:CO dehydrogenase/acetyl-CoA synthase alpha subunit
METIKVQTPGLKVQTTASPAADLNYNLQYLNKQQATQLLDMFNSKEEYAKNFAALKAITRGMVGLLDKGQDNNGKVLKLFNAVNEMQDALLLDKSEEVDSILKESGLF